MNDVPMIIVPFRELLHAAKEDAEVYLSMEKRYIFSSSSLSVIAHGYETFRDQILSGDSSYRDEDEEEVRSSCRTCRTSAPGVVDRTSSPTILCGREIPVEQIGRHFHYTRSSELELWRLRQLDTIP